ncbi:helix-turn-helix domain-containing protein [Sphingobium yanoikuyae]|uniref:XRE family transcriptional regulator n=1 Tax=Sphingobium yanoikuyae TaxID=13690 RepID=A0A430BFU6_SPHYA|nr:helix-turn-helix transcriptional regulator [Sphingobium yanoikuyae]KAK0335462.1 hypothetical protein LTR94_012552 [Friedmanniomyces endolithicus]RSU48394.1 XRE family transcriptional regulator [Sphingobium yanoikuyae]
MGDVQESSMRIWTKFPSSEIPVDIGARILSQRKARKWSQSQLAEASGISRAAVYRLEALNGSKPMRAVRADTLFRIAHALDVPIADFVPTWPEWEPIKGHGLGEGVREARRAGGLSLATLAAEVGVSEATLSRHERSLVVGSFVRRDGDEIYSAKNDLYDALDKLTKND